MNTIILVANEDEAKHLDLPDGTTIVITGEGRTNVIKTLSSWILDNKIHRDDKIINVGYVGAKGFDKGSIVQVGCVEHFIPSETIKESCISVNCPFDFEKVGCFTADNFIEYDDIDPWMPDKFVCDMELYYITLMLPTVSSIKIVSDTLDYDEYKEADFKESWETVNKKLKEIING